MLVSRTGEACGVVGINEGMATVDCKRICIIQPTPRYAYQPTPRCA